MARDFSREFLDLFHAATNTRNGWEVWADFTEMAAIAISNQAAPEWGEKEQEREKTYLDTMARYNDREQPLFSRMFTVVVDALEENPRQDFLGRLFMELGLGSHWKKQIFTPYGVCEFMARAEIDGIPEGRVFTHVADYACGAGATLIAARNRYAELGLGSGDALFVAQDIDRIAVNMCYIQLSLLGCAGWVCQGDSLLNPVTFRGWMPIEMPDQDLWTLPCTYMEPWPRRLWAAQLGDLMGVSEERIHHALLQKQPAEVELTEGEEGQLCLF